MSRINLVGTQHHEPRVKERTAEVIQNNDFDSLFVEGVSPEDADTVEEAVNKWVRQVSKSTGMNIPEDTGENSRFEEAAVAEENFNGDINYLDSTKSGFLNVRDNVKDDLIRASKGEISSPRILSDPDVTQEQVQGIMHMFTPDPDLPYHIFIGDMDEDEYREHLAESAVDMYRERFPAGADPSEEQESIVYNNILEKAPSQEELRQMFADRVYSHETEQDREKHWLDVFEQNYDGEDTALFVGIAHLDEEEDSFYNKLLDSGYDVDRYALKDFTEF